VLTAKFLLAAAFTILTAGCGSSVPRLDVISKNVTLENMIRDAPVIIIGEPKSGELIGPIRDGRCLIKTTTTIENVLRGQIPGQTADFYFYTNCNGAWMRGWRLPQPHGRYVFFLMWDHGVLRSLRDFRKTAVEVTSGRHKDLPLSSEKLLEERLAVLLLTPGDDLNPALFSSGLLMADGFSGTLGRWRTVKMLKALRTNPIRAVRIGACEELTLNYMGQDECWNTLDVGDGSDLRYHHGSLSHRSGERHTGITSRRLKILTNGGRRQVSDSPKPSC
jgi:hypothetical protein